MLSKRQYWTLTGLAAAALMLVATNIVAFRGNVATQSDIATRGQFIQQSVQLEGLYREIIRALAELSAQNNDADLRELLNVHGITFTVNAPQSASQKPAAPTAAAPATKK